MRRCAVVGLAVVVLGGLPTPSSATQAVARVRVPAVVGVRQADAVEKVRAARLVPRVIFGTSLKVPRGFVFAQLPVGHTRVARGSRVAIAVSVGKPRVKVPDVVGESFSDAVDRLGAVGLRPQIQNIVASTRPADTVLAQTPEPGATAVRGSTVALAVSSG